MLPQKKPPAKRETALDRRIYRRFEKGLLFCHFQSRNVALSYLVCSERLFAFGTCAQLYRAKVPPFKPDKRDAEKHDREHEAQP